MCLKPSIMDIMFFECNNDILYIYMNPRLLYDHVIRSSIDCLFVCLCLMPLSSYNISGISWRSVLLVEDQKKTTDLPHVTVKLYHTMLYTSPWSRFELTPSVVVGPGCIGSCKSSYRTTTAMTDPLLIHCFYLIGMCPVVEKSRRSIGPWEACR